MSVRVRYAPSPTGSLHMGSARTTLFNWLFARHHGGQFVLRIEDTDQSRSRAEHTQALCEMLRWLGLDWDEGPEVGGPHAPYNQMGRLPRYQQALAQLREKGALYPCYCTPEELAERREQARREGRAPRYDGRCRDLSADQRSRLEAAGRRPAWRLRVPDEGEIVVHDLIRGDVRFPFSTLDDFVVARSDGIPIYNFVVAVDDLDMEITHVLRADEHLANTPKQLLVIQALGRTPPAYGHLPMVLAADRSKLSKRHGAVAIEEYRQMGLIPEAILNYCALLGWSPGDDREIMTLQEMAETFDLHRVGKSASVYDLEKLKWMNGQYLRRLSASEVGHRARPWLAAAGLDGAGQDGAGPALQAAIALIQERVQTLGDVPDAVAYFYRAPVEFDPAGVRKHFDAAAAPLLRAAAARIRALPAFGEAEMEQGYRALAEELGVKPAALIHPTRLALTGRTVGPSLFALAALIGGDECVRRMEDVAARIESGAFAN